MVLGEALSYGTPIIMYDLPYLEMVRCCKGIERVPMHDIHGMANKIVSLLHDDSIRDKNSTEEKTSLVQFYNDNDYKLNLQKFLSDETLMENITYSKEDIQILVSTLVGCKLDSINWLYSF